VRSTLAKSKGSDQKIHI